MYVYSIQHPRSFIPVILLLKKIVSPFLLHILNVSATENPRRISVTTITYKERERFLVVAYLLPMVVGWASRRVVVVSKWVVCAGGWMDHDISIEL
jgi:hypothetical protein